MLLYNVYVCLLKFLRKKISKCFGGAVLFFSNLCYGTVQCYLYLMGFILNVQHV